MDSLCGKGRSRQPAYLLLSFFFPPPQVAGGSGEGARRGHLAVRIFSRRRAGHEHHRQTDRDQGGGDRGRL
eukprot:scaffold770_cov255-Pinguiococcus_pyrenoidosus.AAC.23